MSDAQIRLILAVLTFAVGAWTAFGVFTGTGVLLIVGGTIWALVEIANL